MASTKPILLIIQLSALLLISHCRPRRGRGFTTDLIHRDSPNSPFYDPTISPQQRLVNAIHRSTARAHHLKAKRQSPMAALFPSTGEYLMNYSLGTPPVPSIGIVDTGSDLIWTQCHPCVHCFNQSLPIFDPTKSSTYRTVPCGSPRCKSLGEPMNCSSKGNQNCRYLQEYGDMSFTEGDLSTDTLTLQASSGRGRRVIPVPRIVIGCGHRNGGSFSGVESGIVGLGGGEASLVRQLGRLAEGKFSYCLTPTGSSKSSRLRFGNRAEVVGARTVRTPFVNRGVDTFYTLTMMGISVGDHWLPFYESLSGEGESDGNIIIDSGTTLTYLPENLYLGLKEELKEAVRLKQIPDPTGMLDLCFETRGDVVGVPNVTVWFKEAEVKWRKENLFIRTGDVAVCLTAVPIDAIAIYGNLAQVNFQVGYDLRKKTVSFKPEECGGS